MPNIRSQEISADGTITVVASDGRTFSRTRQQIREDFLSRQGDLTTRRLATRVAIRDAVIAALGEEQIDPARFDFDFQIGDGTPSLLEFR